MKIVIEKIQKDILYFHTKHGITWFYLSCILLIGYYLRVINLDKNPLGLYADEASYGYNAYCISETLKDEHGFFLPVFFKAFGEYKEPVITYFTALIIKFIGPSIFAVRFAPALFGFFILYIIFKITKLYFNYKTALLATFLCAVSPWMIHFSRFTGNVISYIFCFLLGFYFLLLGLKENKKYIFYSIIPTVLAFYSYGISKAFIPLFYLFFLILNYKSLLKYKNELIKSLIIVSICLLPIFNSFNNPSMRSRMDLLKITNEGFCIKPATDYFNKTKYSFVTKDRRLLLSAIFIKNYLTHMSSSFLLYLGDRNPRHNVAGRGELLFFTFYMSILGILVIFFSKKKEYYIFPIWFFLFPVPAALTWESLPHAGRACSGLGSFEILASVGYISLLSFTIKKIKEVNFKINSLNLIIPTAIFFLVIWFTVLSIKDLKIYLSEYFINYPKRSYFAFDYDFYSISKATKNMKDYDYFLLSYNFPGYPYVIYLFLNQINPSEWLKNKNSLKYIKETENIFNIDLEGKKVARIVLPGNHPEEKTIKEIYDEISGRKIFEVKEAILN